MKQIAYVTDVHLYEQFPVNLGIDAKNNWEIILNDIRSRDIDELVIGGDLGGSEANVWLFQTLEDFNFTITSGNHDSTEELLKHFQHDAIKEKDQLYYTFDQDGYRRIYLDTSTEAIPDEQLSWLQEQLNTQYPVLLFIHHPVFPVASAIDRKHYLRNREPLQKVLRESDQRIFIFCGHYHMDDEQTIGKITQIITPAVSYQVIKHADPIAVSPETFTYRIISMREDELSTEVVTFECQ